MMEITHGPVYRVGAQFTEQLNYSNPLGQTVITVWYNNYYYFLLDQHIEVVWKKPPQVPVKEYLFFYPHHDDPKKPGDPTGHYPVLSLLPGSYHYQPVVEEVLFIVPRDYDPAKFRSEDAIKASRYPIIPTHRYFVRAVL
ncbi:hypothetical protein [Sulfobacillus harzensis]|uniref:Uncharacterized protein n=1 Tax=Sulfobacillus harzensis TaxID=2729629 RepID=A0A7Y0L7Z2_9FIRM|nr:hypothetical protein [Sulfobacillus harzensis]NMP24431.1 hypothetical protein [Sulfobacillus harzensis]